MSNVHNEGAGPQNSPVTSIIMGLKVGESANFPIRRMRTIRTLASELGAMFGRQYSTCMDRAHNNISVIRKL